MIQQRGILGGASHGTQPAGAGRRALVVDDELGIRESLAEILGHIGYHVDTAPGGREALDRLAGEGAYGLVLSDISMPGMSGMEFYRHLRERHPALAGRFIVVTGDHLSGAVRAFLDETGVPYLEKPFIPSQVRRLAVAIMGGSEG